MVSLAQASSIVAGAASAFAVEATQIDPASPVASMHQELAAALAKPVKAKAAKKTTAKKPANKKKAAPKKKGSK